MCSQKAKPKIAQTVNTIHEFAHLVHSAFFEKNSFICEGFAEAFTLYTLDYESLFEEHRKALQTLQKEQIFSVKELLQKEKTGAFYGGESLLPNHSCSFDLTYISSCLFVRSYIELLQTQYHLNKIEATQKFLEVVRHSECINEWFIYDLALAIQIPKEELLYGKERQTELIKRL